MTVMESGTETQRKVEEPAVSPQVGPVPYDEEVSLWTLATMLVRYRWLALGVAAVVLLAGLPFAFRVLKDEVRYTTYMTFIAEGGGGGNLGATAQLASRLGLAVPGSGAGSASFYADLLRSRTLLGRVAEGDYLVQTDTGEVSMTIAEVAGADPERPVEARVAAISWLRGRIGVAVQPATGVVNVSFWAHQPDLARQVAVRILDEVHNYNVTTRQQEVATERRFVAERLAVLRAELEAAEARVAAFLRENRQFERSPELRIEYERLQRDTDLKQSLVTSLAQSYEQARIEEVRNTPVITVFEEPETPLRADQPRSPVRQVLSLMVLSVFIGMSCAVVAGVLERSRSNGSEPYREFEAALRDARSRFLPFARRGG
jgi:uncharacterized protein involved in exopolysaccharide biosynthesis